MTINIRVVCLLVLGACATPSSEIRKEAVARESYELRSADEVASRAPKKPKPDPGPATAELPRWPAGARMKEAVDNVAAAAQRLRAKFGHIGFDDAGACVMGAFLPGGKSIRTARALRPGVQYVVIGAAHQGVQGVSVRISNEAGQVLGEDADGLAVVEFEPPADGGKVIIEVAAPGGGEAGAFIAVSIMRAGGVNVPGDRLSRSFGSALQSSGAGLMRARQTDAATTGVTFHEAPDWALYSVVMAQGETWDAGGIDVKGPMVVVTGTDGAVAELNLSLSDADGKVLSAATDKGPTPMALLASAETSAVAARLVSTTSASPSLVTLLLLDVARLK